MPISAADAFNPAFQHVKRQLFQPFRFTQWLRLALVGFLAGELGSGGGCNVNLPATHRDKGTEQLVSTLPAEWVSHLGMLVGLVLLLIILGTALWMALLYISCVMRFILFDSVVAGECHIRKGWRRRTGEGLQLFAWQILLAILSFASLVVLIGIPLGMAWMFGWFTRPKEHILALVLGGLALLMVFLALVMVLAVIYMMTKDFVVPQMALESISAAEGWRRLWEWMKMEKAGYAGYVGMKIVLAIGAGIAVGFIALIAILMLLLPIGGAGVIAVLAGKAAGWTWNLYTISLAVVAGGITLLLLLFVVSFLNVPAIVFFPAYSIYFLAGRYRLLADTLWPAPPAVFSPPSPEPPPRPAPTGTS